MFINLVSRTVSQKAASVRNFAMKKKYHFTIGVLFAVFCLLSVTATPGQAYTVYPNDPYWGPDDRTATDNDSNAGTAGISDENPRSGNASLKLTIGGDKNPYDDWAFYTRTTENTNEWGLLSDVSALSFDWFRATETDPGYLDYDPWNLQTPVIRLLIQDGDTKSELVWEQYYTDILDFDQDYKMQVGEWVTEDLIQQNFWRYSDNSGYTISTGKDMQNFGTNTLLADTISDWASGGWAAGLDSDVSKIFYSDSAFVYGLSVGAGSSWPGDYLGYVDNIYLAFNGNVVLDDNFELPVPEPSTWLLLGTGIATLLAGRRRRARR